MKKLGIIILNFLILNFFLMNLWAKDFLTLKDYLKAELMGAAKTSRESFNLDGEQKKRLREVASHAEDATFVFYYAKDEGGGLIRACTVLGQEGKEGPMEVGVCFSPDGLIKSVRILNHVEDRGKGIENSDYLSTYTDKKISDPFEVGKDIVARSGATRSSSAVAEAVRRANFAFKAFILKSK